MRRLGFSVIAALLVFAGTTLGQNRETGFLNRTVVECTREGLVIYHTPLPWIGNKRIAVSELAQLYREEVVRQGDRGARVSYQLSAVSRDQRKIKLISGQFIKI